MRIVFMIMFFIVPLLVACGYNASDDREPLSTQPYSPQNSEVNVFDKLIQEDSGGPWGHFTIMDQPSGLPLWPILPDDCIEPATDGKIIFVCTGAEGGTVSIRVETLASAPASPAEGWAEVFDTYVSSVTGDLYLWTGTAERWPGISKPLTPHPGAYHVRIHINGRLENRGWATNVTDESYLIQVWEQT